MFGQHNWYLWYPFYFAYRVFLEPIVIGIQLAVEYSTFSYEEMVYLVSFFSIVSWLMTQVGNIYYRKMTWKRAAICMAIHFIIVVFIAWLMPTMNRQLTIIALSYITHATLMFIIVEHHITFYNDMAYMYDTPVWEYLPRRCFRWWLVYEGMLLVALEYIIFSPE